MRLIRVGTHPTRGLRINRRKVKMMKSHYIHVWDQRAKKGITAHPKGFSVTSEQKLSCEPSGSDPHHFYTTTQEEEAGRSLSLRPAWSTKWVLGQAPRLQRETLSQKKKKRKKIRKRGSVVWLPETLEACSCQWEPSLIDIGEPPEIVKGSKFTFWWGCLISLQVIVASIRMCSFRAVDWKDRKRGHEMELPPSVD